MHCSSNKEYIDVTQNEMLEHCLFLSIERKFSFLLYKYSRAAFKYPISYNNILRRRPQIWKWYKNQARKEGLPDCWILNNPYPLYCYSQRMKVWILSIFFLYISILHIFNANEEQSFLKSIYGTVESIDQCERRWWWKRRNRASDWWMTASGR